jgi:hypothetical protein
VIIRQDMYETIPMDQRYPMIIEILNVNALALTSREIAERYIYSPTESDRLVTGTILNVLTLAGIVKKFTEMGSKHKTNRYVLDRSVRIVKEIPA